MSNIAIERRAIAPVAQIGPQIGRRTLLLCALGIALAVAGGWYGYGWWTVGRFIESTDDAYAGGNVTEISPHVAGFVAQILVADNQNVHAGQKLIRLDSRDFTAALKHAEAVAEQREAALAGLRAKYLVQQSTIREAQSDLAAKTAGAVFAGRDDLRYRTLALTSAGTGQAAERALAVDQEARSAAKSAEAGVAAATQQLTVLEAAVAQARAAVAQAEADLETARLNLGYTQINSPIDGYIGNRAAQTGAYVAAGAYLLSVIPAHDLWVDANFKEDQLARMAPGQPATVVADALPGRVFHGRILSLAPGTGAIFSVIPPENATGNFTKIVQRVPVRIALEPGNAALGRLRPGLSTTVSVDTRPGARGGE
jgi:membrane fusion protein (multidrug efflux system)